jgi:hypothetical protein
MKNEDTKDRNHDLDNAGRALLLAARATDAEVEAAIASPFLYPRVRARMQEAQGAPPFFLSLILVSVMRRAIMILAVIAVLAVCSYTFAGKSAPPPRAAVDQPVLIPISQPKAPVTACSITSRTECVVSTDDVVALLVNSTERQK